MTRPEETPIDGKLLVTHQHNHRLRDGKIMASPLAVGMIRLIADNFSRTVQLIPLSPAEPHEELSEFPPHYHFEMLFEQGTASRLGKVMRQFRAIPKIIRLVREADVVQVRMPAIPSIVSGVSAIVFRKKYLLSVHANWAEQLENTSAKHFGRAATWFTKFLASRAQLTLVTGEHLKNLVGGNAFVFANHQFSEQDLYKRKDTCEQQPFQLLYVGRLSHAKGTYELLQAFALLREKGFPLTLTLIGSSSQFPLQETLEEYGIESVVSHFESVPWGEPLFHHYRSSDLFVFPSHSEGTPKAPMEALSQSLPVVSTTPGTEGYITHGKSGLLVPPKDVHALTQAIIQMLETPTLRQECIRRGMTVAQNHTRERMETKIRKAIRDSFPDKTR